MPLNPGTADILTTPAAPTVVQNATGVGAAVSYAIVPVNEAGQDGVPSAATTTPANNASPNVNCTISWVAVPGASQYRLLKNGALLTSVGAGVTSFTDSAGATTATYVAATSNPPAFVPGSNVPLDGQKATFSAGSTGLAPLAAGDIFVLSGSASKTIRLIYARVSGTATAGTTVDLLLIKRTTADTGGTTGSAPGIVPNDSNNPAVTGAITVYTAAPTMAGSVGNVRAEKLFLVAPGSLEEKVIWDFGNRPEQAPVLRGVAQQLCFQVSAAPAGGSIDISIAWTEE